MFCKRKWLFSLYGLPKILPKKENGKTSSIWFFHLSEIFFKKNTLEILEWILYIRKSKMEYVRSFLESFISLFTLHRQTYSACLWSSRSSQNVGRESRGRPNILSRSCVKDWSAVLDTRSVHSVVAVIV